MDKVKKPKKIIKRVLLGLLILVIILITVSSISNAVISKNKKSEYADAYGEFVDTPNGRINYSISGNGDTTIVLLPGHGSASPHYEFSELTSYLSTDFKVITVEPLGYGLSDNTNADRTTDIICNEIHEVLSEINEKQYYLMGHSISGLYALNYSNKYSDEVLGFIGIDASLPEQINDADPGEQSTMLNLYRTGLINTGFLRLSMNSIIDMPDEYFNDEQFIGTQYSVMPMLSKEEKAVYAELMIQKTANPTVINEIKSFKNSCLQEMDYKFPETVPVLYILSEDTISNDSNWIPYHEKLASNNSLSKVTTMEGTHYLHLCNAFELYKIAHSWINETK